MVKRQNSLKNQNSLKTVKSDELYSTSDPSYLKSTRLYINWSYKRKESSEIKRFETWTVLSMWRSSHINSVTWPMGNYNQGQNNQRHILSQSSLVPMVLRLALECQLCVMGPQCYRALSFKPANNGYASWKSCCYYWVSSFVTYKQVEHNKLLS